MVFFDRGPLIFEAITAPVYIYKWELVYMTSFFSKITPDFGLMILDPCIFLQITTVSLHAPKPYV